eukprot:CAMPEP_0177672006 /NCGR_PEP_ID=MMETSP0447-20121125/25066_1 /TAXON_ID=0 /ORGANISM="Stygamoeba regulata, Strain BSH-02190019" /LENGTH=521 /DNA_ID=CAMNT_0019179555 /DNA_START=45 /DNA_END=1610 /DNA_ORIENTATION=-
MTLKNVSALGLLLLLSVLSACASASLPAPVKDTPGFSMLNITSYVVEAVYEQSTLYTLPESTDVYAGSPVRLLHLRGTRQEMGYAYARLIASDVYEIYHQLISQLSMTARLAVERFVDYQWTNFLSVQLPEEYVQELQGIDAGVASLNNRTLKEVGKIVRRVLLLANLPSDLPEDLVPILQDELDRNPDNAFLRRMLAYLQQEDEQKGTLARDPLGLHCSMFAVWGTRTEGDHVYSCRNLDYAPDTGINTHKLITVWSPSDGAYAHAAFGYTALYGALAGMSSQGVSVHEANLEEDLETFSGFPWVLRLRYIMEKARTIDEAQTLWAQTNNTVGYNHMVACEADAAPNGHAAVAMETARNYTAYFLDNDPREANAVHVNSDNQAVHYGDPLPEALYRTNHGYDSFLAEHYQWWTYHAYKWSQERYMMMYYAFMNYTAAERVISTVEALNITSIVGDKSSDASDPVPAAYACADTNTGTNILSVMYDLYNQHAHVAWGKGTGEEWRPAACNTYIMVDLKQFW